MVSVMTASAPIPDRTDQRTGHAQLTVLNGMAGIDIATSIDRHRDWGLELLDLKDQVFDRWAHRLEPEQAEQVTGMIAAAGLRMDTISSPIGSEPGLDAGEAAFRTRVDQELTSCLRVAAILRPRRVRLIAPQVPQRAQVLDAVAWIRAEAPWAIAVLRDAVDRIVAAGCEPVLENEIAASCLARPSEVLDLFAAIDRPALRFTWDVVNLWQMGTAPSLTVYRQLRPVIGLVHVKGGRAEHAGGPLRWRSALADADWPVTDILRAVVDDGASDVICLNPPHGADDPARPYDWDYAADLRYLRAELGARVA